MGYQKVDWALIVAVLCVLGILVVGLGTIIGLTGWEYIGFSAALVLVVVMMAGPRAVFDALMWGIIGLLLQWAASAGIYELLHNSSASDGYTYIIVIAISSCITTPPLVAAGYLLGRRNAIKATQQQ